MPDSDTTFVLPAGWAALTTIGFSNWCVAPPKLPFRFDLLVGSAQLKLGPTSERSAIGSPDCMSAPETPPPSLGYTGPFRVPGTPEPPEPNPVDSLPVRVDIPPLPSARPGETLDFTVTLTDDSPFGKPFGLGDPCPSYTERLFLPSARQSIDRQLLLNCADAGVLAPGASLAFEMRLSIPADAPSGSGTLIWQLGDRGPAIKVPIQIVP